MRGNVKLPYGETITIVRTLAGKDRHGDPLGDDTSHTIAFCGVDWNAAYSNQTFQDVQITDVDLFVPRGADIVASDKVELPDGRLFRVQGKPMWDQLHPMTGTDFGYKLVRLREVSGA